MILKFKNLRENKSQNLGVVALEVNGAELKIKVSEGYKLKKANHDGVKLDIKESKREKGNITYTVILDEFLKDAAVDEVDGVAKGDGKKEEELELELTKGINKMLLILMFLLLSLVVAGGGYIYKEKTKQPEKVELGNGEVIKVDKETGETNIKDVVVDRYRYIGVSATTYQKGADELYIGFENAETNKYGVMLELYKARLGYVRDGQVVFVDADIDIKERVMDGGKKQKYITIDGQDYILDYIVDYTQSYYKSNKIEVGQVVDKVKLSKELYSKDYIVPQKIINSGDGKKVEVDRDRVDKGLLLITYIDDKGGVVGTGEVLINIDVK